ncbi:hypothetical protein [Mycobacterium sp.]|uniref:hypothetical protein n=1 Tax=Mycobacterium sp. TaxID=1785 RepID=UPI003F9A4CD6
MRQRYLGDAHHPRGESRGHDSGRNPEHDAGERETTPTGLAAPDPSTGDGTGHHRAYAGDHTGGPGSVIATRVLTWGFHGLFRQLSASYR